MTATIPLPPGKLRWHCPPEALSFGTTAELTDLEEPIGQERAIEALQLALAIRRPGYNVYAMGPDGIGKHTTVRRLLEAQAAADPRPADWLYAANFDEPNKPRILKLPAGRGQALQSDMVRLVSDLHDALRNAFEGHEYRMRRQVIEEELKDRQEQAVAQVEEQAKTRSVALIRSPIGFAFAPMVQGRILPPEQFAELEEPVKVKIAHEIEALQGQLREALQNVPSWMKETRDKLRELNDDTAAFAVNYLLEVVKRRYLDLPEVASYLEHVRKDVVDKVEEFLGAAEQSGGKLETLESSHPHFRRYRVNLLVDNRTATAAPVIYEDDPSFERLVGRIEHRAEMGTLVTDFHMIRSGALHRANGGYLVLDMRKVLARPMAYEGLKRALLAQEVRVENPLQALGLLTTQTLDPEPTSLDVKVVLVGERLLFYLAAELDPEFNRLFKIPADFNEEVARQDATLEGLARLIATLGRRERLRPLDASSVGRLLEHAARRAGHAAKFSTDIEQLADLLREADHWATVTGEATIGREQVVRAIETRERRLDRLRERLLEQTVEGTVAIATEGAVVGQMNGLSVVQLGGHGFGRPTRITARIRMGPGSVLDIEREVKLGGPLHSKGVLILGGYLMARYATDVPLSLMATLVFEQSYGGVEGDSASSAELYALLSAIAEVPIGQQFAVTGSVNQRGEVQAIGGVNEKIEGFFDLCVARGLKGNQGVLIPAMNVRHLMLRERIIAAVEDGEFNIYPIDRIDQGVELLTGMIAGEAGLDGHFPEGTFNRKVEERLRTFAERRRAYAGTDGEALAASEDGNA